MRRTPLLCLVAAAFFFAQTQPASAGYGLHPNSETTPNNPTFTVYLEAEELPLATLYVASDTAMDGSSYIPVHELGQCYSFTPTGQTNIYTCQPAGYSPGYTSVLPPGHYVWWLTFYHRDPGQLFGTLRIAGPMDFTIAAPQAPTNVSLVSPADGASVSATPTPTVHAPAGSHLDIYVADSADRDTGDGSPTGIAEAHCGADISTEGNYTCTVGDYLLSPGTTYYWWAVVTVNGYSWVYGPRSFTVKSSSGSSGSAGGGVTGSSGKSGSSPTAHDVTYAPYLSSSEHYVGKSIKSTRLSSAAYTLSKILHVPKSIAVACWGQFDWSNISGDNPESAYSVLGFYWPAMPHWIQLSPAICHSMETLIYHRPLYANTITANGVDTLTHEMIHALGITSEARTECYAMQLTYFTAHALGVPVPYAENLGRLTLSNYLQHPPSYVDTADCREGGSWDIYPTSPSLPWHMP